MPIVVITFIYSNEVALSLTFFVASLLLSTLDLRWRDVAAALALCLALFSRIDVLLLVPFWFTWIAYYSFVVDTSYRERILRLLRLAMILVGCCLLYWALFLRALPPTLENYTFEYNTNIKLLLGFLTYPFNLSIVVIGTLALIIMCWQRRKESIVYFLLLLPVLFYLSNLSSPKYIISLALFLGIPTAVVLSKLNYSKRLLVGAVILGWWFVSLTPYGLRGPITGAYWFLPTDDGPIPTGSYLSFYNNVRNGFYQERYIPEMVGVALAISDMKEAEEPTWLLGRFNPHFYNLELVVQGVWHERGRFPWEITRLSNKANGRILMIARSYLHLTSLEKETGVTIRHWLENGQIRAVAGDVYQPFPELIEIGDTVSPGTDDLLGERVLFMDNYYHGHKAIESSRFVADYRSLCWLPNAEKSAVEKAELVYEDSQFVAVSQSVPGCRVYNSAMPFVYYGEQDPRPGQW